MELTHNVTSCPDLGIEFHFSLRGNGNSQAELG